MTIEQKTTARIHLLPAKAAPYVVILRRKPSKTFHVIRWNTETDTLEQGSWFNGHLYVTRCDVSFDGQWMVYLARGASGTTWNGVCRLPFLKTHLEVEAPDTWGGGGYWKDANTVLIDTWKAPAGTIPFRIEILADGMGLAMNLLYHRLLRDGWVRNGNNWGTHRKVKIAPGLYDTVREGDDGWRWQFEKRGPTLEVFDRGYIRHQSAFEFRLREFPELLDREVEWATFDAIGNLVFTRAGWVYRYSRSDLSKGKPGFAADLNSLDRLARSDG